MRADRFVLQTGYNYVLSGNGNVDFGGGYRDYVDLSAISSSSVKFNFASSTGANGVLYNPGNGTRVFDSMTLNNGMQILFEGMDSIRFADGTMNLSVQPNDPLFNQQWNLHMMGAHQAWYFTQGSDKVLVGVQDTGIGADSSGRIHPDLGQTYFYSNNVLDEYLEYGESQPSSHGNAVQGIISAKGNNGIGLSGINWNSPVFNIDVLGGNANDQSLALATQNMIDFAKSKGQKLVINMSLGGGGWDSAFERVVANNRNNALFVIATGNDNRNSLSFPAILAANYDNVVAVGASWGTRDYYGNAKTPGTRISYAGWWGSNYGTGITVMGPSEVITTEAKPTFTPGVSQMGYDGDFNGTSAATPNVSGVASLAWSANRSLTAGQIKGILSQTSYDLGTSGYDYAYGYGFVNADAAVRRALAMARTGGSITQSLGADSFDLPISNVSGESVRKQVKFQSPNDDGFSGVTIQLESTGFMSTVSETLFTHPKTIVNPEVADSTSVNPSVSTFYPVTYDEVAGIVEVALGSDFYESVSQQSFWAEYSDELMLTYA